MFIVYTFLLITLFFVLLLAWPTAVKIEEYTCPLCKEGKVLLRFSGSEDQWCTAEAPCNQCGYNCTGLTEDVLWP
jgi:hypothetical protein